MKGKFFIIGIWIVFLFIALRVVQRHIFYSLPFGIGGSSNFVPFLLLTIVVMGGLYYFKNKK